jgi:hypothetical protein
MSTVRQTENLPQQNMRHGITTAGLKCLASTVAGIFRVPVLISELLTTGVHLVSLNLTVGNVEQYQYQRILIILQPDVILKSISLCISQVGSVQRICEVDGGEKWQHN